MSAGSAWDEFSYASAAKRLREEFDASFAEPPAEPVPTEDLLAIRLRGEPFALCAREISGLATGRKIVPLPERSAPFLGLAGHRGQLVPVWDLAALVGYGGPGGGCRWLALGRGESLWAVAFDVFEGYHRVPVQSIFPLDEGAGFMPESCNFAGASRPVIRLSSILVSLRARTEDGSPSPTFRDRSTGS
jgi:purine-binding chemotaxis protein CheW